MVDMPLPASQVAIYVHVCPGSYEVIPLFDCNKKVT